MRKAMVLVVLMFVSVSCGRKAAGPEGSAAASAGGGPAPVAAPAAGAAQTPSAAAPGAPSVPEEDLAAFASGSLVVQEPEPDSLHSATWLLRGPEDDNYVWEVDGAAAPSSVVVIELPERSLVKQVEFDSSMVTSGCVKDVGVEVSDTSAKEGFSKIADVSLQERVDNQVFPVSASVPGRWIRLNVKSGYNPASVGLGRFRARGTRLTNTPFANVTGTYSTRNGAMHIRQDGTSVVGCYEYHQGTVEGGVEGRIMKLTWHEKEPVNEGAAFMVFSSDGQKWAGLYSYKGEDPNTGRFWTGTKSTSDVGTCPGWPGSIEDQMAKDLEEFGRARIYGINFDSDSDHIRDESRPTLDHVAAMLKARPQWSITIEGHTDSTATAEHNQDLSERRAQAVRQYLESAGIVTARLSTAGYGATRPVSSNDTPLGRAQNRRVELVKQQARGSD
jgi:outer membrane protein OmpA-like peptidoglycan-associated protein